MTVCSFSIFFQESLLERELQISMNGRLIFSEGFIFRWKGHPIRVASALMGVAEGQKSSWSKRHHNHASPHQGKPWFVVTGSKRSMNYKMLWKIYKKRILTLKEKALPHRSIFKRFLRSVQHVYLMVDFKPLLDLSNFQEISIALILFQIENQEIGGLEIWVIGARSLRKSFIFPFREYCKQS